MLYGLMPDALWINGCLHFCLLCTPVDKQWVLQTCKNKLCDPQLSFQAKAIQIDADTAELLAFRKMQTYRDVKTEHKPVESTLTISCPGYENSAPCLIIINNVTVDENDYMLLDNGTVISPPNLFKNITCKGNMELQEYSICPPRDGMQHIV